MTKTLKIDNRDTENIHIDTYSMLTGESADDMMREYEEENARTENREYNKDFDIDYDMKSIVKDLANVSIGILENNVDKDIIKSITLISTSSPKFYNYTTDGYVMAVSFNEKALNKYIEDNKQAVKDIFKDYSHQYDEDMNENIYHAGLCHLLDNCITKDDYNIDMWEEETNVYYEHMTIPNHG